MLVARFEARHRLGSPHQGSSMDALQLNVMFSLSDNMNKSGQLGSWKIPHFEIGGLSGSHLVISAGTDVRTEESVSIRCLSCWP
jgi:hypothetical protein